MASAERSLPNLRGLEVQMKTTTPYLLAVALLLNVTGCSPTSRLCNYTINADVKCRVCDIANDNKRLVEYFNADTNELRLFLIDAKSEIEIEHPFGQVQPYYDEVDANSIKFDTSATGYLSVNGQKFMIKKRSPS